MNAHRQWNSTKMKFLCFAFLLPALSCSPLENHVADDYLPRAIEPNEEFVTEAPPVLLPESLVANIKPVEFQYFVPSQDTSGSQRYYSYDVIPNTEQEENTRGLNEDDYVDDNGEGLDRNLRPPPETAPPTSYRAYLNDAILKQYFGSKSKYFFDKDQVGSPGKENRFRRSAGDRSTSYSSSSASASSSSGNIPSQYFSNQGFDNFNQGFGHSNFGPSGFNNYDDGYQGQGGYDQSGYSNGFNNGGYANPSSGFSGPETVLSRFGNPDVDGSTNGASGTLNNVKGVSASSSSSIDSNGRATYSLETKKFG